MLLNLGQRFTSVGPRRARLSVGPSGQSCRSKVFVLTTQTQQPPNFGDFGPLETCQPLRSRRAMGSARPVGGTARFNWDDGADSIWQSVRGIPQPRSGTIAVPLADRPPMPSRRPSSRRCPRAPQVWRRAQVRLSQAQHPCTEDESTKRWPTPHRRTSRRHGQLGYHQESSLVTEVGDAVKRKPSPHSERTPRTSRGEP
jgi:hypothetical protein